MSQAPLPEPLQSGKTASILSRLPAFYRPEFTTGLLAEFINTFGQILEQAETDLLTVMHSHYVDTANNKGSQGLDAAKKGDLDKIFSMYLASLGGTSQLRQGKLTDEAYRQRMRNLISVLKNGASTRAGILEIVAANLGIAGDTPEAKAARAMIRLEEFAPEKITSATYSLGISEEFTLYNPSLLEAIPEIHLVVREDLRVSLVNPKLVNLTTNESIQYRGQARHGAVLTFFPNATALLDGVEIPSQNLLGQLPSLPPGSSRWRIEAKLGLAAGYFDQSYFDNAMYEQDWTDLDSPASRSGANLPVVDLHTVISKLTPGTFTVRVPWNIPGITDNYDASETDPRNQIKYIIERVKAAGIRADIAYEQAFRETQELQDHLKFNSYLHQQEIHDSEEANFNIGGVGTPYPGGVVHEMSDELKVVGVFDYTRLDYMIFGE